jgi:hypothetical protein
LLKATDFFDSGAEKVCYSPVHEAYLSTAVVLLLRIDGALFFLSLSL